jgi:hypothetical protein
MDDWYWVINDTVWPAKVTWCWMKQEYGHECWKRQVCPISRILGLFNYTLSTAQVIQDQMGERLWKMNWEGCGKKQSWPISRYCNASCLQKLKKITKKLASGPRIKHVTSEIWSRSAKHWTIAFWYYYNTCLKIQMNTKENQSPCKLAQIWM